MNKALEPINEKLAAEARENGSEPLVLEAGLGINSGQASVGNMGSKQRFAYSALGDTVNLASRLEGQTKQYGVRILIGEKTRLAAPDYAALELSISRRFMSVIDFRLSFSVLCPPTSSTKSTPRRSTVFVSLARMGARERKGSRSRGRACG